MSHEESLYPHDWGRIAEKDLKRVELLLEAEDADAAGFYLQQGVEKLLKAFLLSRGWKLQRIHDLEALLNEARAFDHSLTVYSEACQKITDFYIIERYPFSLEVRLTPLDVTVARDSVRGLIEALRRHLDTDNGSS